MDFLSRSNQLSILSLPLRLENSLMAILYPSYHVMTSEVGAFYHRYLLLLVKENHGRAPSKSVKYGWISTWTTVNYISELTHLVIKMYHLTSERLDEGKPKLSRWLPRSRSPSL